MVNGIAKSILKLSHFTQWETWRLWKELAAFIATMYSEGDDVYSADLPTSDLNICTCRKNCGFNFHTPSNKNIAHTNFWLYVWWVTHVWVNLCVSELVCEWTCVWVCTSKHLLSVVLKLDDGGEWGAVRVAVVGQREVDMMGGGGRSFWSHWPMIWGGRWAGKSWVAALVVTGVVRNCWRG